MKHFVSLVSAILLLSMAVPGAYAQEDLDEKYATELVKAGTKAPDFVLKTPDGKAVRLSKFAKGKTVVLDFWASWCSDCRREAPTVVRMYEDYRRHGIEFIGISMDTDVEAWKKAIAKYGITYTQVSELKEFHKTDIAKAYGIKWIPSMVVVGPDGQVKLSTVMSNKVDKYLQDLTGGRPLRVACVGNSVTYGYGLRHRGRDAYPVRLQQMLDSAYGSNHYEVANFGHSGATLLYRGHRPYIKTPEFHQALDFRPDWVVIHLGLNDTDPRNWPDWKEDFIPNYRALIDSFLAVNPEARILVCRMTPIFDRHPRFQSGTRDWHEQIQHDIEQVAFGAKAQLVDLYKPLHSRPDLFPDALHPNPRGAEILAKTVYGALTGDYGGLRLPPLYGNGMVLQRSETLNLHGTANARQQVEVVLKKGKKTIQERTLCSKPDGSWETDLSPMEAGGPYTLTITASTLSEKAYQSQYPPRYPLALNNLTKKGTQTITIDSVYFGDVWLASGQSNMEMRVDQCNTLDLDLADAQRLAGRLHLFNMPVRVRTDAVEWGDSVLRFTNELHHMDFQGWKNASPEVVKRFSAIAFNFGRMLCDSLSDVPIGIVCNAVGGSTTESWIDRTTLERELPNILHDWRNGDYGQPWARGRMTQNIAHALDKESPAYNPLQRHPYEPCYLFEAAIQPLERYPMKGVIWYQGESNAHNLELHAHLFPLLVKSWRENWNWQGTKGPFYFVQLSSLPRPSWPAFRNSQRQLVYSVPNAWMAVSSDLGDAQDVHYRTKRPVGERLALQALHYTYHHSNVCDGPVLMIAVRKEQTAILHYASAEGLAVTRGFEIAGPDGVFYPADIKVEGECVHLSSPKVTWPAKVRYGWSGFTDADLRNGQGLPASTIQMDVVSEKGNKKFRE